MYVARLAGRLLAPGLALCCSTGTAAAQLYEQTPSGPTHNWAYWSSTSAYGGQNAFADSFQVTQSTLLTRITWWGIYDGEAPNDFYNESFTIRIYADDAGQPGAVLVTYTPGDQVFRTLTGRNYEESWQGSPPVLEYFFSMTLPAPLTLQANTRYWISITTSPYDYVYLLWESSPGSGAPGVHIRVDGGPWMDWGDSGVSFRLDR
jgi:hypothetical protein